MNEHIIKKTNKCLTSNPLRLHILGLPHTQIRKDLPWTFCAYTQKVYNLCKMFYDEGHEIFLYAHGESTAPCTKLIDFYPKGMFEKTFGKIVNVTRTPFDQNVATYQYAKEHFAKEVNKYYTPNSLVLAPFGDIFSGETFKKCKAPVIESAIGYASSAIFAHYKVWESHSIHNISIGGKFTTLHNWSETVIPGYIDPNDFIFSREKGDYFLYLGRLEDDYLEAKGCNLVLELQKKLGFKLKMAGPGKPKTKEINNIEYMGPVFGKEKAKLLANAKGLLALSYFPEPFCYVVIEALMSGTPVITTDNGAFVETVKDQVGFRCVYWSDMVNAIKNIDQIDRQVCRDYAMKNFNLEHIYSKYYKFFKQVLAKSKHGWYFDNYEGNYEKEWHKDPENLLTVQSQHAIFKYELEIDAVQKNKNILEIGGGPQSIVNSCLDYKLGTIIDPIDFLNMFPILQHISKVSNLNYICSKIEDFKTDQKFDEIWSCNVAAHVEDIELYLETILKLCLPGTILRIAEPFNIPNEGHPALINDETFNILRNTCKKIIKDSIIDPKGYKFIYYKHQILILEF